MRKRVLLFLGMALILQSIGTKAWTLCPPDELTPNPAPIVTDQSNKCIISSYMVPLSFNQTWSKEVTLEAGKHYWFSATKCKQASSIYGAIKDKDGNSIKFSHGPVRDKDGKPLIHRPTGKYITGGNINFCFSVPETAVYTVLYTITGLNTYPAFAYTQSCLSESKCVPEE